MNCHCSFGVVRTYENQERPAGISCATNAENIKTLTVKASHEPSQCLCPLSELQRLTVVFLEELRKSPPAQQACQAWNHLPSLVGCQCESRREAQRI